MARNESLNVEGELTITHRPYEGVDVKIGRRHIDDLFEEHLAIREKGRDENGYEETAYGPVRLTVEVISGR